MNWLRRSVSWSVVSNQLVDILGMEVSRWLMNWFRVSVDWLFLDWLDVVHWLVVVDWLWMVHRLMVLHCLRFVYWFGVVYRLGVCVHWLGGLWILDNWLNICVEIRFKFWVFVVTRHVREQE